MRSIVVPAMVLGVFSTALPFTLIAWGETRIDSGVAAIGNASMPIFVALFALRFRKTERATGARLIGVLLGLIGVAVLAGVDPKGGWAGFVGTLAVVAASVSYAIATLYTQNLLDTVAQRRARRVLGHVGDDLAAADRRRSRRRRTGPAGR